MHGRRNHPPSIHQSDHDHGRGDHGHDGPPFRGRGRGRGPGRHGRGGRRRNRVSRGEVRNAVLVLLTEEPMHGYQLMQEMQERSDGGWEPSPGSIYPTLQQLADEGLVQSESHEGKNVFSLTDDGRSAITEIDEPPAWERFKGEGMAGSGQLKRAMMQLGGATRQVGVAGTDAQVQEAVAVLTEARKRLYRILADDEDGE